MLKHLAALATILSLTVLPANAQSAHEISKVKSGESCPGCNLFQADLSYMTLKDLDLSGSRLRQASLSLATTQKMNFSRANLSVSNMFGGVFTDALFINTNLQDASLVGSTFKNATFIGANLSGANFSGADLSGATGLTQSQLNAACGDNTTRLRGNLTIPRC